jgi:hypothetical protein
LGSSVTLEIFDPRVGTIVATRWLGGRGTVNKLHDVVSRPPGYSEVGYACWGQITAAEAVSVAEASYADGATPEEVAALSRTFPPDLFWWMIMHDS